MDLLENLDNSIVSKDYEKIINIIDNIFSMKNIRRTHILIDHLINYYSEFYISRNIWIHTELLKILQSHEIRLYQKIIDISFLITQLERKNISLYDKSKIPNERKIDEILDYYKNFNEYEELCDFKNVFYDKSWTLIHIIYDNCKKSINIKETFSIITYLIGEKKIQIRKIELLNLDKVDYLFLILKCFIDNNDTIDEKIKRYITCSKNLFYYRLKKKDKIYRINLLFYCFYICITKNVKHQKILYKRKDKKTSLNQNYLYIIFYRDISMIRSTQDLKNKKKLENNLYLKNIDIDSIPDSPDTQDKIIIEKL